MYTLIYFSNMYWSKDMFNHYSSTDSQFLVVNLYQLQYRILTELSAEAIIPGVAV